MPDTVKVIEDQIEIALHTLQVGDKGVEQSLVRQAEVIAQQAGGVFPETRQLRIDGRDQVLQQALGLAVGLVARQPGYAGTAGLQAQAKLAEHRAFAKPGWGAQQDQALFAGSE
ncbi:hypothetical protein D9M68_635770 [compost metagenome]